MPKMQIFKGTIIIVILAFICMYIYDNYKVETKTTIVVRNSATCSNNLKEYYKDSNNNKYYFYCIDDIIIDYTDRTLELKRALEAKQIDMEFVLSNLNKEYSVKDKKLTYYKNDDFSIIKCKTQSGKYNYIFGTKDMEYKEGVCEDTPYLCKFSKTYYVLDVNESKNKDNIYLTIKNDINSEVETIKLDSKYVNDLTENSYYQFDFGSKKEKIDQDIKDIFTNNTLIKVSLVENDSIKINDENCD